MLAATVVQEPPQIVGTVIADHYRIVSLLGTGSMGGVYEVEDVASGRRGAMKILLPEPGKDPEIAARLVREGKTMRLLAHRNIVESHDVGCLEDGTPFVVTELVRGVSLRALLDEGPVETKRALAITRQLLDGLDHAHSHGVIHRDIKPENIMLVDGGSPDRDEDFVKVLDFGVAKLVDDTAAVLGEAKLTRTGFELFGSPLYVAPESVLGRPIDPRTDIYSVGVVLFELLTGRPPFDDPDPMVLLRQHAATTAPTLAARAPDRTFTAELEYIVAESLAKQPERRFASARDMITMLDSAQRSLDRPPTSDALAVLAPAPATAAAAPASAVTAAPAPAPTKTASVQDERTPLRVSPMTAHTPERYRKRDRRRFMMAAGAVAALLVIALVISLSTSGGSKPARASLGSAAPAVGAPSPRAAKKEDAQTVLARGHADFDRGRHLDALGAYERAIAMDTSLAADPQIRTNATTIVTGKDPAAAVVGLEILASRLAPPAHEQIVAEASKGTLRDVRHRAFAIAERDGFADSIDRFESFVLDLRQAKTCDDRRIAIAALRGLSDRRAIGAIRRVKSQYPCIDKEATEVLTFLEAQP